MERQLPWLKVWTEMLDDPKLHTRNMSDTDRWLWICLLMVARSYGLDGLIPVDTDLLAWRLRRPVQELEGSINKYIEAGMVTMDEAGNIIIPNFLKRQEIKTSESPAGIRERVARYRERRVANGMSKSPGYDRAELYARDGGACVYCGSTENLVIDHLLPVIMGGTDNLDNLATACRKCNGGKSGRTPEMAGYTFVNKQAERRYLGVVEDVTVTGLHTVTFRNPPEGDKNKIKRETKNKSKSAGARPATPKRASPISDPFEITDSILAWAQGKGYDVDRDDLASIAESFVNHHKAKGTRYIDWEAAFKNWVNRDIGLGWGNPRGGASTGNGHGPRHASKRADFGSPYGGTIEIGGDL